MTDIITTERRAATEQQATVRDRRRPGRLENPSPELIALMRKPTEDAIRKVAMYDAPHFVPPTPDGMEVSLVQLFRFGTAFAVCALAWMAVFKTMMVFWG